MNSGWSKGAGFSAFRLLSEAVSESSPWQSSHSIRNYAKKVPSTGWKNMTSKRGKLNFYKGRGVPNSGVHSSKGRFTVLPARSPQYIVPDVRGSLLAPYVERRVRPPHKLPKAVQEAAAGK
eukprot:jgi/Ulvmu1/6687/UM030_0018.1